MADISIDEFCLSAAVSSARNGGRVAEDACAHFDRGIAWARIGAYEQALEEWRQTLRLSPDLAKAYAATGSVYMVLGCWQEAVRSYQNAILAAPHLLESYYGLGSAYGRLGEYGRAIDVYEQAFQLLPIESDLNREVAAVYFEEAATDALSLEPDTFPDRLRSDSDGFDISALLSSPAARRQAVRQEQATVAPATTFFHERGTPERENAPGSPDR